MNIKFSGYSALLITSCLFVASAASADKTVKIHDNSPVYSQHAEQHIIRDFFNDRKDGVFLDVGSSDYKKYSNTYFLEKNLGWSGVAIDALTDYADDYEKYRPNTKFVSFFVSNEDGDLQPFYKASIAPVSTAHKIWLKAVKPMVNRKEDDPDIEYETLEIPTITLNTLLEQLKIEKIDFMSMDIELHEPAALAGFDIQKYRPELVCIEAHPVTRKPILEYFSANNYELIKDYLKYDRMNWYFRPKSGS